MVLDCRIVVVVVVVMLRTVGIAAVISSSVGPGGRGADAGSAACVGGVELGADWARLVPRADSSWTQLLPVRIHSRLVASWGQGQFSLWWGCERGTESGS